MTCMPLTHSLGWRVEMQTTIALQPRNTRRALVSGTSTALFCTALCFHVLAKASCTSLRADLSLTRPMDPRAEWHKSSSRLFALDMTRRSVKMKKRSAEHIQSGQRTDKHLRNTY